MKKEDDGKRIKASVALERLRYYKNEWGIAEVSIERVKQGNPVLSKNGTLIIKGAMPQLVEGSIYTIVADYVNDDKWGDQYNLVSIYTDLCFENDSNGKKKFLAAIFTPLQIQNMYEILEDPFTILSNKDAQTLIKVKGCGLDTAARWITRFHEHLHLAKMYSELEDYNLSNNIMNRLLRKYKSPELVISKIKNDPYVLCNEVDGIGWKTADKIALEGGMSSFDSKRIAAFILHYLNTRSQSGCDYISTDELMGAILEELGEEVPDESISEAIHSKADELWWNSEKTQIGLQYHYWLAQQVARHLIRLKKADTNICPQGDWHKAIKHLEHKQGWQFTEEQMQGVQTVLTNNVCVITGGPGTGKSSLVAAILEVLKYCSYAQCALSGRASSRMAEITGQEGYTIHRLLGFPSKDENSKNNFTYHDENPLDYDIIIVDEISMVDASLFYYLIRAVRSGSKLIMLGDPGQLESIGNGNIAHDIIQSPEIPTVFLTKIQRQAADSAIVTESQKMLIGEQIVEKDWVGVKTLGKLQDLTLDCYSDKSNTFYKIMTKFSEYMNQPNFDIMSLQIIVPMKWRGDSCTYNLNNTIQELYNPSSDKKNEITQYTNGQTFVLREYDKVINVRNNYNTDPPIFNGNIGIIKEINTEEDYVDVDFLGIGLVHIEDFHASGTLELGYAVTVHKMQGSEFDNIIFGLDFSSYAMLNRNLMCTGVTRAKKKCDLICQTGALRMAVSREWVTQKTTHLPQTLYDEAHPILKF